MPNTDSAAGNDPTPVITAETRVATLRAALRALKGAAPPLNGRDSETTEGPYDIEGSPVRQDIAEGRGSVPLDLRITVLHEIGRSPVRGAVADVWHCDTSGWSSGYLDIPPDNFAFNTGTVPPTDPECFLQGMRRTDSRGVAEFRTIYPAWHYHQAAHIHLKVRLGGREVFTGQLCFPEKYNQMVATLPAYREAATLERVPDADDSICQQAAGGQQTSLDIWPNHVDRPELGFTASFTAAIIPE